MTVLSLTKRGIRLLLVAAPNYNSYDAAVYAAASSYLQSKVAGTGNVWMGTAKKTGSAGYGGGSSSFSGITSSNIAITGGGGTGRGGFTANRGGVKQKKEKARHQEKKKPKAMKNRKIFSL